MAQVRVKDGAVDLLADLTNISVSGALIDIGSLCAPSWLKVGRIVDIGIIHPVVLDTIEVGGRIVRVSSTERTSFAVHYVNVDATVRQNLKRLQDLARAASCPVASPPRKRPPPLPGAKPAS
jgi:hypothetical protein